MALAAVCKWEKEKEDGEANQHGAKFHVKIFMVDFKRPEVQQGSVCVKSARTAVNLARQKTWQMNRQGYTLKQNEHFSVNIAAWCYVKGEVVGTLSPPHTPLKTYQS